MFSLFYNYSSFSLTSLSTESFRKHIGENLKKLQPAELCPEVETPLTGPYGTDFGTEGIQERQGSLSSACFAVSKAQLFSRETGG